VRIQLATAAVVVLLVGCGSSSASTSPPSTSSSTTSDVRPGTVSCGPAEARTLAASGVARVYALNDRVYGCSERSPARSYQLGDSSFCNGGGRAGPVAVAEQLVAYGLERCGVDTGTSVVALRRMTDGRVLGELPALTGLPAPESYAQVTAVLATPAGAVAWIALASSIVRHTRIVEVHEYVHQRTELLDSGPAIGPGSLRLRGTRLSWQHGSTQRHATFG